MQDVYVQLRDSSGNRITTNHPDPLNSMSVACIPDNSVLDWLAAKMPSYKDFCSAGYPQYVSHIDGVWHYTMQVQSIACSLAYNVLRAVQCCLHTTCSANCQGMLHANVFTSQRCFDQVSSCTSHVPFCEVTRALKLWVCICS